MGFLQNFLQLFRPDYSPEGRRACLTPEMAARRQAEMPPPVDYRIPPMSPGIPGYGRSTGVKALGESGAPDHGKTLLGTGPYDRDEGVPCWGHPLGDRITIYWAEAARTDGQTGAYNLTLELHLCGGQFATERKSLALAATFSVNPAAAFPTQFNVEGWAMTLAGIPHFGWELWASSDHVSNVSAYVWTDWAFSGTTWAVNPSGTTLVVPLLK